MRSKLVFPLALLGISLAGAPGMGHSQANTKGAAGWDLTISDTVIVSDTTLGNDQHFAVTATVRNIGSQSSPAGLPIRVIQSADTTVDAEDPRIDFDTIENPIAAGDSLTQLANVTETSPGPGTYWIFVCTDSTGSESNVNNNCSEPVAVVVSGNESSEPPTLPGGIPGWDLTISDTVIVSDLSLDNDQHFSVTATVRNIGTQSSPAPLPIRVIQSADMTVDMEDPQIDFDTLENPIAAGGSFTQSANVTETSPGPGTYWIFVCTDTAGGEANANNNCSAPVQVTVSGNSPTTPPIVPGTLPGWDLTISDAVIVSDTTLGNDQHFSVTATVRNIGTQSSPGNLPMRIYQSADTTVDDQDPQIDFDTVENPIAVGGSLTQSANVTETSPGPGTYWIIVCTDTAAGEANANNNCSTPVRVTVSGDSPTTPPIVPGTLPGWDLTISDAVIVSDTTLGNDQHFAVTATVRNIGTQPSPGNLPIQIYQSADTVVDVQDPQIDFDTVENPIVVGGSLTQSANVTETSPGPGTYWIIVCTATAAGEANVDNNCSTPVQVTVSWDSPPEPPTLPGTLPGWDLTISDALVISDLTLTNDQHFAVTATVRNIGTQPSPGALPIRVIQSADNVVDATDPRIDFDTLENPILPGGSFTQSANVTETSPGPGLYWIFVCTDTAPGEANANNNCSAGQQVAVDTAFSRMRVFGDNFGN